ncbi:MAG TPA: hypothetical protein VEC06_00500 [Paucimonas sp.]|nr:hypothetical protein [Paucimonas sp.]
MDQTAPRRRIETDLASQCAGNDLQGVDQAVSARLFVRGFLRPEYGTEVPQHVVQHDSIRRFSKIEALFIFRGDGAVHGDQSERMRLA